MMQYAASTIAKWFIDWADAAEAGLSNMKLQKLLYYAQGHYLAETGDELFPDEIQAWSHGPVVPTVYREYKSFGSGEISLDDADEFDWSDVDPETTAHLNKVWNTYGAMAAWKLRNMTHAEDPWRDNFEAGTMFVKIPPGDIRDYFTKRRYG